MNPESGDFTGYYKPSGGGCLIWPAVGKFQTDKMESVGWVASSPGGGSTVSTFCGQFSDPYKHPLTLNGTNVVTESSIIGDPPAKNKTVLYTWVPKK